MPSTILSLGVSWPANFTNVVYRSIREPTWWDTYNIGQISVRGSELERLFEPRHEKTNILHMRIQRRRSASR